MVSLQNFAEAYSLTNLKKYDTSNSTQKHLFFKQFFAWSCNSCSTAPLTKYTNNPVYQELPTQNEYFNFSDEIIYLDPRTSYGYTKELEKLERND